MPEGRQNASCILRIMQKNAAIKNVQWVAYLLHTPKRQHADPTVRCSFKQPRIPSTGSALCSHLNCPTHILTLTYNLLSSLQPVTMLCFTHLIFKAHHVVRVCWQKSFCNLSYFSLFVICANPQDMSSQTKIKGGLPDKSLSIKKYTMWIGCIWT